MADFRNPAWRQRPFRTLRRVLESQVRRRLARWREVVVSYDGGRSRIVADLGTALGLELFRYGYWDPEIELVRQLLTPGSTFVDGGAHIGLFTLVAADRVGPNGKVIAFEPSATNRGRLEENLRMNRFDWVQVHPVALADRHGTHVFVSYSGDESGYSTLAPASRPGGTEEVVETVRLDDMLDPNDRAGLRLIKLDLEGAEHRALQGASETLAAASPDILLEIRQDERTDLANLRGVQDLLTLYGYQFLRPRGATRGGFALDPIPDLTEAGDVPNVLATRHPENPVLTWWINDGHPA